MGMAVVTSRRVSWLSRVTARGVATTRESDSELRKERTALTPWAFRKATFGEKPPSEARLTAVLESVSLRVSVVLVLDGGKKVCAVPSGRVTVTGVPGDVVVVDLPPVSVPLPMVKRWAESVSVQSMPLRLFGF